MFDFQRKALVDVSQFFDTLSDTISSPERKQKKADGAADASGSSGARVTPFSGEQCKFLQSCVQAGMSGFAQEADRQMSQFHQRLDATDTNMTLLNNRIVAL